MNTTPAIEYRRKHHNPVEDAEIRQYHTYGTGYYGRTDRSQVMFVYVGGEYVGYYFRNFDSCGTGYWDCYGARIRINGVKIAKHQGDVRGIKAWVAAQVAAQVTA